ncbi:MAG: hypothetical protein GY950_00480 [bacterium]|nr:hypothetical protein [bacterium]
MEETVITVKTGNEESGEHLDRVRQRQLNKLLSMRQSTTKYLEKLAGKKLKVKTEFQKELYLNGNLEIVRVTLLYFDSPGKSVIYSITSLPKRNLSDEEVEQLKAGKVPMGRIFKITEMNGFKKTGIKIKTVHDRRITRRLNVAGTWFYSKEYCLRVGKRRVGSIKEIFNEESFSRVWS